VRVGVGVGVGDGAVWVCVWGGGAVVGVGVGVGVGVSVGVGTCGCLACSDTLAEICSLGNCTGSKVMCCQPCPSKQHTRCCCFTDTLWFIERGGNLSS